MRKVSRRASCGTGVATHALLFLEGGLVVLLNGDICKFWAFYAPMCLRFVSSLLLEVRPIVEVRIASFLLAWLSCVRAAVMLFHVGNVQSNVLGLLAVLPLVTFVVAEYSRKRGEWGDEATVVLYWRTIKFAFPEKTTLFLVTLGFGLLTSLFGLLEPRLQGRVLDVIIAKDSDGFKNIVSAYVFVGLFGKLFAAVRRFCLTALIKYIGIHIRTSLFEGLMGKDLLFFQQTRPAELISRLTGDVESMMNPVQTFLNSILVDVIHLVGGIFMCLVLSWKLTVFSCVMIGPIIFITTVYVDQSRKIYHRAHEAFVAASSIAHESLMNIRTVKVMSTETYEVEQYNAKSMDAYAASVQDAKALSVCVFMNGFTDLVTTASLLYFGGGWVLESDSQFSIGALIAFQLYWGKIRAAFRRLNADLDKISSGTGAAERVFTLIDKIAKQKSHRPSKLQQVNLSNQSIYFNSVCFAYPSRDNKYVLDGVTFEIKPNTLCAIVGQSGCGKSTIMDLLLGLCQSTQGTVLIGRTNIDCVDIVHFHSQIGVVTQQTQLFRMSIKENLVYGLQRPCSLEEIVAVSKLAHVHEFIEKLPEKYDTILSEQNVGLSGGQAQRLSLARCLLRKPRLILLDEATSALDSQAEVLVQEVLGKIIEKKSSTILVVAHRLSSFVEADNIILIKDGRVDEFGTHDNLLARHGSYAELVSPQLSPQHTKCKPQPSKVIPELVL